jgi:hypothetical protein
MEECVPADKFPGDIGNYIVQPSIGEYKYIPDVYGALNTAFLSKIDKFEVKKGVIPPPPPKVPKLGKKAKDEEIKNILEAVKLLKDSILEDLSSQSKPDGTDGEKKNNTLLEQLVDFEVEVLLDATVEKCTSIKDHLLLIADYFKFRDIDFSKIIRKDGEVVFITDEEVQSEIDGIMNGKPFYWHKQEWVYTIDESRMSTQANKFAIERQEYLKRNQAYYNRKVQNYIWKQEYDALTKRFNIA